MGKLYSGVLPVLPKKLARYEVYKGKAREGIGGPSKQVWRWRLISANGRIIATGEAHTRERDAWRAVDTVAETAPKARRKV
jgi:uncharacterized protein YegP (UPF0339 family)